MNLITLAVAGPLVGITGKKRPRSTFTRKADSGGGQGDG